MYTGEIEKSRVHILVDLIEYIPNSVVIKTILKKSTGNITVLSFDGGEGLSETTSAFDTYIQIIDGSAEIVISGVPNSLKTGQFIVVPAHESSFVNPNGRFKMVMTVIKSGYDL